jgi:hypothetical protein
LILAVLKEKKVIRSGNAPAGDYAELLVRQAPGGALAPASQKSWDVETPEGERLQVKSRVVTSPDNRGERQLSPFRSWDFDAGVIVLFDDRFGVWRAAKLAAKTLEENATWIKHVSGWRVIATDKLLDQGEDWMDRLRGVQ